MLTGKVKGGEYNTHLEGFLKPADALLVASPSTVSGLPQLGLHLLQASCQDAGINTRVLYSNVLYSKLIGLDLHKVISSDYHLLLGERIFATAAFNIPSVSIGRTMHKFLDTAWVPDHLWQVKRHIKDPQIPKPVISYREWLGTMDLEYLESLTADWLHALARQIVNIGFPVVGCSTTFGGLVPAVALLNCIKKTDPNVITIIGGALCEAEMAEGILSLNTSIDYVFSGEGETTFPSFVKQVLDGGLPKEKIIYGQDVTDLDTILLPNYRDYFNQIEKFHPSRASNKNASGLPFEISRGCRYGKCTFCGLNGKRNLFRAKSPNAVIQDLKALVKRHGINFFVMSDTMMPSQYFSTLIPRLTGEIPSIKVVYELRANLTLDQVLSLKKTCVMLKTGIESLSPSLLRRMNKPYKVRENIALLRYARSAGIKVIWSLLFGFPGDQINEYEEMLHLIPLIRHLQPPSEMYPLLLFRFSKYQRSPGEFGMTDLQPAQVFKDILPPRADFENLAYYFNAEFPSESRENPAIINELWKEYQAWRRAWASYETIPLDILLPTLHVSRKTSDRYVLEDTRGLPGQPKRMEIDREQASLLLVARPLAAAPDIGWALDAGLGAAIDSQFIPLATAEPSLLQEFECEFERD